MTGHRRKLRIPDRLAITPTRTAEFYRMPGWWITLVLLSAVLTGLGIGHVQENWFPGGLVLLAGLSLLLWMFSIWWRARRDR